MYFVKTPYYLKRIFSSLTWDIPGTRKDLYLTFDDGPTEILTDFILDQLRMFNAKATFFCLGRQIDRHPETFHRILQEDHAVGNHGYGHLNGWKTPNHIYLDDVARCSTLVDSSLFRPPYGKIKIRQLQLLKEKFRVVMWDVSSGDFDEQITGEQCLQNVLRHSVSGSIIVMHDSRKASEKVQYVLPKILEHYTALGFQFRKISATANI